MQGPLMIFIAAILWGLDGILRRTLYTLPPATIVFYEHLIGALIIAPFLFRLWRTESLTKREWSAIVLVSLFSGVIGTLAFTIALLKTNFISFSVVYLVQKLQPIFTIVTAWIVLGEKISRKYLIWAALAIVAAYFVIFPNGHINWSEGGAYVIAALFALLAAAAWGSSTAFSRYTLMSHSHTLITALRFWITVPLALLFVFGLGATSSLGSINLMQLGILVLISLSTGMIALWIYYRGLRTTRAQISTIIELAYPLVAVVVGFFLYGDRLVLSQYLAAAVLLFTMYKIAALNQTQV